LSKLYKRKSDAQMARKSGQYIYKVKDGYRIGTRGKKIKTKKKVTGLRRTRKSTSVPIKEFLPSGWRTRYHRKSDAPKTSPFARFKTIGFTTSSDNKVELLIDEKRTHIEIMSIDVKKTGTGDGTKIMKALKRYADSRKKGIVIHDVASPKFFKRFDWLERTGNENDDYIYRRGRK